VEGNPTSNNGAGAPKSVIPFAPKLDAKADELDRAGHAILDALRQATGAAEAKYQQAVEKSHQLSGQLRSAEERIKELEARLRHQENRAERGEKWLYQISIEIEQKFFDGASAPALRK
jgi:flagellar motility protein MotE (MotC chaperone)